MLNAMNGATYRYSRSQLRRMFYPTERKISFLRYALLMPLFELFVIWGVEAGVSIDDSSAAIVVAWLSVNCLCLLVMTCSCGAFGSYRMMIHAVQCFRMPLSLIFMCERIFNSVIGVESIFIALMFLCSLFEFFHVQDYFSVFSNSLLDPLGYRNNRKHRGDNDDDESYTEGPVLPNDSEHRTDLAALTRKRIMEEEREKQKTQQAASEEEDADESITELDDKVPACLILFDRVYCIAQRLFEQKEKRRARKNTESELLVLLPDASTGACGRGAALRMDCWLGLLA